MNGTEFFALESWTDSVHGMVHLFLGLGAIVTGAVLLLGAKGGPLHRVVGTVWALALFTVNTTALTLYGINGGMTLFHWFALLNLAALIPGYLTIRLYQATGTIGYLKAHRRMMTWAYFGLVAAGVWQAALKVAMPIIGYEAYGAALMVLGVLTMLGVAVTVFWLYRTEGQLDRMTSSDIV